MLDLRPSLFKLPAERELDVLHQMARKLDVTNISRVVQRALHLI